MFNRKQKYFTSILIVVSNLSSLTYARKALGGSGGLLTSGQGGPSAGFGESPANDPLKLVDISENSKAYWTVPPIDADELIQKLGKEHRDVAQYVGNMLGNAPLSIKLNKKRVGVKNQQQQQSFASPNSSFSNQEKYRAQVKAISNAKGNLFKKSKLRSVWYVASEKAVSQTSAVRQQNQDLLSKSYDENSSHFHPAHFVLEVFLPKTKACKGGNPLVRYCVPMGAGTTSPKSRVSQSNGYVTVFPSGRKKKDDDASQSIKVGSTSLHLNKGASLIDQTWSRGRKYFRTGRNVGQV